MTVVLRWLLLLLAASAFTYYLLAIVSARRFFAHCRCAPCGPLPPASILKPLRGLDADCFENLASFCRQNYPRYEILFCVSDPDEPVAAVIRRLQKEMPDVALRLIVHRTPPGQNDKVAKLATLARHARYPVLVVSDSDVRVAPDYLQTVVAPLTCDSVGLVTCLYRGTETASFVAWLEALGQASDFYPGLVVDWQLEGVKFALGSTMAIRADVLRQIGGWEPQLRQVADDLLLGRRVAEAGYKVVLLPYAVSIVPDYQTLGQFLSKRLRWAVVMRHMRPWGHLGLGLTQGLPWSVLAGLAWGRADVAVGLLLTYLVLRAAMTWQTGIRGLGMSWLVKKLWMLPLWDALATGIWLVSFLRRTIRWRGADYVLGPNAVISAVRPSSD
jgi:ceramide glucosyltransferase